MDELEVKIRPGTYPNLDDIIVEGEQPTILLPCIICNKTFIPEALQRHSKVCEKNATKKRKTFDSFKQRVQGTELAEFLPLANLQKRNSGPEKPYSPKKTVSHWKEKHEAFVSAIRAARGCGEGSGSVGIVETRLSYRPPDHERCPYCERHFGPKAFDRHQEWCREQHARQPPSAASQLAKERLEARIKYRAPPIKSKRALTREKYSPLVQRKARQLSPGRNSNHSTSAGSTGNTKQDSHRQYDLWNRSSGSGNSLSGRSSVKDSYSGGGLNRGMPSRTSLRASQRSAQRSVSPLKRSTISTKSLSSSYSQPPIQDRKSQDGGGDSIPSSYNTKKNLTAGGMAKQAQQRVCESQLSPVQKQSSSANSKPRKMQTEEKENIRIINNKNKKSDQKWRLPSQANAATMPPNMCSPMSSFIPVSSNSSSNPTPRKCLKKKGLLECSEVDSAGINRDLPEIMISSCDIVKRSCRVEFRKQNREFKSPEDEKHNIPQRTSSNQTVCVGQEVPSWDVESDSMSGCSISPCRELTSSSSASSVNSSSTYITHCTMSKQDEDAITSSLQISNNNCPYGQRRLYKYHGLRSSFCKAEEKSHSQHEMLHFDEGSTKESACVVGQINFTLNASSNSRNSSSVGRHRRKKTIKQAGLTRSQLYANDETNKVPRCMEFIDVATQTIKESETSSAQILFKKIGTIDPALPGEYMSYIENLTTQNVVADKLNENAYERLISEDPSCEEVNYTYQCNVNSRNNISNSIHSDCIILNSYEPCSTTDLRSEEDHNNGPDQADSDSNQGYPVLNVQIQHESHVESDWLVTLETENILDLEEVQVQGSSDVGCINSDQAQHRKTSCVGHFPLGTKSSSYDCDKTHEKHYKNPNYCSIPVSDSSNSGRKTSESYRPSLKDGKKNDNLDGKTAMTSQELKVNELKLPLITMPSRRSNPLEGMKSCLFWGSHANLVSVSLATATVQSTPPVLNYSIRKLQPLVPQQITASPILSGGQPEEPYDPYASAERQMMELLHSDSACDVRKAAHTQKSKLERSPASAHSISPVGSPTNSPKSLSLETSPTSAFTRYTKETEPPSPESQVIPQPQCQSQTQLQKQSMPQTPQPQLPLMQHTQTKHDDLYHSDSLLTQSQLLQTSQNEIAQSLTLLPLMQQPPERQPPPQSQSQTRETQAQQTRSETQLQPLPPPRSFKRSASLQATSESSNTGVSRTPLESFLSIDVELVENNNTCKDDLDNRPGTYDVERSSGLKYRKKDENGWLNSSGKSGSEDIDAPVLQETADGVRSEILLLDNKVFDYKRCGQETRESREIREITENSCGISGIDGLLEEVVRMQRSVSMLNAQEPNHETPVLQSSVRSRRSRAGKMHIEDYLFPAELLQQEDINLDDHSEHLGRSSLVFGSTKSRRTSSKGRRLIEDLLFPSLEVDINANSDVNEDSDVIVSANALMGVCTPPVGFNTSPRGSPVALTSKMINDDDDDDGLPRPKPLVSTRSSQQSTGAERVEPVSSPDSPIQLSTVPKHQIHQTRSRLSSDSAYNSLNRRSPIPPARRHVSSGGSRELSHRNAVGGESPQSVAQSVVLSSSSSESSLPPLSAASHIRHSGRGKNDRDTPCSEITSATTPFLPKLSKFCHECGTRFPMTAAKFCHECGVKRLEL